MPVRECVCVCRNPKYDTDFPGKRKIEKRSLKVLEI